MFGILNRKGIALSKHQLEDYIEKFSSDNIISNYTSKQTYPIPQMLKNFEYITKVYNILNEHVKLKLNIHPAGEWLLDNYYIIEESVKTIKKDLSLNKYTKFIGLENEEFKGYARIYVLACEILTYTENNVNEEILETALKAYQRKKSLSMNEIWNIGLFLKIGIIQNIADVCENIYSSQLQKYRAQSVFEDYVENKTKQEKICKNDVKFQTSKLGYGELKYPFIESLSYKLKNEGKKGKVFLDCLEEQVNKMGSTISEVIKKEHFNIAAKKVLISNSILTIKRLNRMNFLEIFEKINSVEEILKLDPLGIYEYMDYKTKEMYRNVISEISKKTKISEIYIAQKAIELAQNVSSKQDERKKHIGYYLIDDGKIELLQKLNYKTNKNNLNYNAKAKIYVYVVLLASLVLLVLLASRYYNKINLLFIVLISVFLYIPITEIVIQIMQYVLGKVVKPKELPKMDFINGIPEQYSTIVVIPTIVSTKEKVKELINNLEVYYLANKSKNLYFTLLGDCTTSSLEVEQADKEIIQEGLELVEKLNEKYKSEKPIFHFLYRKRRWNDKEEAYLGWERKRGLLTQFNEYILNSEKSDFIVNTFENSKEFKNIKYIITLDADTELTLDSASSLIGTMAHVLNKPIIKDGRVVKGHGLIQPKVGINITASRKSMFTKIFAGSGGTDLYTNAISDLYQDCFNEGIFTGKGIYDLKVFSNLLKNAIPENTVLSHDLLEGSYLRCGLASDILIMDGYPYKYNSFISRLSRWIRGDWQINNWIFSKVKNKKGESIKNPLNFLSKFKIIDNLRRSLFEICLIIVLFLAVVLKVICKQKISLFVTVCLIALEMPMIIELLNKIIFRKDGQKQEKTFTPKISGLKGIFIRAFLAIAFLPHKAYISLNSIIKTIYRKNISKKHLLEWTTAEEAERNSKTNYSVYYKQMYINIVFSVICLVLFLYSFSYLEKIVYLTFAIIWAISPAIACFISYETKQKDKLKTISKQDLEYVKEIAKRTWQFFKDGLIAENNYLPPDNYQEERNNKFVDRTSSTNIGLALLSVISAYDLGFENLDYTIDLIQKIINTIEKMEKWNGHIYNWYNINTLKPLFPRYVSTVDSGNLVGYLYVTKQFLISANYENKQEIKNLVLNIDNIIKNMNFTLLYDEKVGLFSIGFNVEDNELTNSYYDLLASEARQASLIAIAKKDVPTKHWKNLSRTLTNLKGYKGLISWSGTAFEYLMPKINIRQYEGSLLDESCKFMIMSQMEYSKKIGIPWGTSESAFYLKDLYSNYQYKAFGIPWLGLKRGLSDDNVVSSYGSMLWINEQPNLVIKNVRELEKLGGMGKYGLYESIDFTRSRLDIGKTHEVVKTFMAHHQGLILLSINNLINSNIIQNRFSKNPEIKAIDILLQEKMPENLILTKEKKEKPNKIVYHDYENYTQTVLNKGNYEIDKYNVISNQNYTIVINQKGEGYSKYKNIFINRYKETSENSQGIFFYLKNIKTNKIWTSNYMNYTSKPNKYTVYFAPDSTKIVRIDENIETTTKITVDSQKPIEIRNIQIKNNGKDEETLEITSSFEPIISPQMQDVYHPIFNDLFLRQEAKNDNIILERRAREKKDEDIFMGASLFTENETIGELEYEFDKEKFFGRGNIFLPIMVKNSIPFSRTQEMVTQKVVAMKRTIKIKPGETANLSLIISISNNKNEVINNLEEYKKNSYINKNFELVKTKASEEIRYFGIKGIDVEIYKGLMSLLLVPNKCKKNYISKTNNNVYSQEDLWKFGISGDFPIILVRIKDTNDSSVLKEILKAYEYLRFKNILFELVILDEEKYSYNSDVGDEIENCILNSQISYMKNVNGGIFVVNAKEISKEDLQLLEFRANLIIDSHLGNLKNQLKDIEEEYKNSIKNIGIKELKNIQIDEEQIRITNLENKDSMENLKYYNEFGAFSKDGKEYYIKVNKDNNLPTTWSHIIANKNFGTLVTEGLGGYTWNKNSRLNRITAWNNNPTQDIPSEIFYLVDSNTGNYCSLGCRPIQDNNDYFITYGFGYAIYEHYSMGINQKLTIFIPKEDSVKVNLISLKNNESTSKKIKLLYYIKPVLGEDEIKSNSYIKSERNGNIVYIRNLYTPEFKNNIAYISTSENIKSFTGNKDFFIGNKNIENPDAINKVSLDNESGLGNNSCSAVEIEVELKAYEEKELIFLLGEEESEIDIKDKSYKYTNINNCKQELENVKKYWNEQIGRLQVKTPVESMNLLLNGWCLYQTTACRLYAKSGYYQSGGAIGFRDQLQDTLGLKYTNTDLMKNQIILHAKHQFIQGDVLHWWHKETNRGIRTRFSDDLLWLVYLCSEYIETTGDLEFLEVEVPYLEGEVLPDGISEKYEKYLPSQQIGTIYEHCTKAIDKSLNFGKNGLPKIGSGDWNDGLSEVGTKGIGESVWLGFFLYNILDRFTSILEVKNKKLNENSEMLDISTSNIQPEISNLKQQIEKYKTVMQNLKKALNINAWDGRWFKRAFMDDGNVLGSMENEECRIDGISQSWGVISNAADNEKKLTSMESLETHLVDKENGIIKLLDPPFNKSKLEPGYIKSYLPGVRENGGQYTHECCCCVHYLKQTM